MVSDFASAGSGGVAWGPAGRIYFASSERPQQNDLYRINVDATGEERPKRVSDSALRFFAFSRFSGR